MVALACNANAETITGLVVSIADGDTITVLDASAVQHKIRRDRQARSPWAADR